MNTPDEQNMTRLLPGYLLELLSPDDQRRVAEALAVSADLRRRLEILRTDFQEWADEAHPTSAELDDAAAGRLRGERARSVLGHLLACEDCRLEASVVLAGTDSLARRAGISWPWRPLALAACLVLAVASGIWVGERFELGRTPDQGAFVFSPVALRSMRSDRAANVIRLSELRSDGIELQVETRMEASGGAWELTDANGNTVQRGRVDDAAAGMRLQKLRVLVPRAVLLPGELHLIVHPADGSPGRTWVLVVED